MAKTYLWIQDSTAASPDKDTTPISFDVYNDCMSYAKWISTREMLQDVLVFVWNIDGGSGEWNDGSFTSIENTNYP
jgi:hypothetical protein